MTTLIVAAHVQHAANIHAQLGAKSPDMTVTYPGEEKNLRGRRFDLILVTDYYTRFMHYESADAQATAASWIEEQVMPRRSKASTKVILL